MANTNRPVRQATNPDMTALHERPLHAGPPTALLHGLHALFPAAEALGKRRSSAPPEPKQFPAHEGEADPMLEEHEALAA